MNRRAVVPAISVAFITGLLIAESLGARGVVIVATGVAAVAAGVAGAAAAAAARRAQAQTDELAAKFRALEKVLATLLSAAETQKVSVDQLQTELKAMEDRDRGIVSYLSDIHRHVSGLGRQAE